MTGPLTLAMHVRATAKPYDKLPVRIEFFTDVIAREIAALAAENATVIQIDEPSLVFHPENFTLLNKAWARLAAAKGKARLALGLYFGNVSPLVDGLKDLPFDIWQLEVGRGNEDLLRKLSSAPARVTLGLGVVDARSTWMEPADATAAALSGWLAGRADASHYLTPSAGLEFLPRLAAQAKLRRLSEIRRLLSAAPAGGARG